MNHSVTNVQEITNKPNRHTNKRKRKSWSQHKRTFESLAGDTRWKVTWSTKTTTKYNSTFTHSYTPIQSFNPHVINVMTNGGVKQLYIVQFIFVTMILPSQVLFPFINIRRRALQIRKCSEISESISIYILYMYTNTPDHRDTNIFANVMLYNVTHKQRQYNLELFFLYNSILCSFFLFRKNKMLTWSQRINNSHQCNIFNKSKNIKFKTSDAYLFCLYQSNRWSWESHRLHLQVRGRLVNQVERRGLETTATPLNCGKT